MRAQAIGALTDKEWKARPISVVPFHLQEKAHEVTGVLFPCCRVHVDIGLLSHGGL